MAITLSRRLASMLIGATVVALTAAMACTDVNDLSQPSCTYAVSGPAQPFGAGGGNGTVAITAPGVCPWTATSDSPWVSLAGTATGTGNGSVAFTVSANPTFAMRSSTVTIAGNAVPVMQSPTACTYVIAPESLSVGAGATTVSVAVTAASSCTWTASSDRDWIVPGDPAGGSGAGTVSIAIAANTALTGRSGTLTIAGKAVPVAQGAAAPPCTIGVSAPSASFSASGGSASIDVTAGAGCSWSVASDVPWITVSGSATRSGAATITYAVAVNAGPGARAGRLTIGPRTIDISQAAPAAAICSYQITPPAAAFTATGGQGSLDVTAANGCNWSLNSDASWLAITGSAGGSGSRTVAYTVASHSGTAPRTGRLTLANQTLVVTQAGACSYQLTPSTAAYPAAGGAGQVDVTAGAGCAWTASSDVTWIVITAGGGGSGTGAVSYTVAATTASSSRTGHLTIAGRVVTVTQSGVPCTYVVTPASLQLDEKPRSGAFALDTQPGCAWTAVSSESWLTITTQDRSGTGDASIDYTVSENKSKNPRTATVTIGGRVVPVTQAAAK